MFFSNPNLAPMIKSKLQKREQNKGFVNKNIM